MGRTKEGLAYVAILVILVLVVLWAAVLIPPILRSRNSAGVGGVSDFMDSLRSLGGRHHPGRHHDLAGPVLHGPVGGPAPTARDPRRPIAPPLAYRPMPGGISPMQRRRRNVLVVLTGAAGVTFLFALMARSMLFIALFLVAAAALGGYCYLLVQMKQNARARHAPPKRTYVTPIEIADDAPKVGDNVILLRRNVG